MNPESYSYEEQKYFVFFYGMIFERYVEDHTAIICQ